MKINAGCDTGYLKLPKALSNCCNFMVIDTWEPDKHAKTCDTGFFMRDGSAVHFWNETQKKWETINFKSGGVSGGSVAVWQNPSALLGDEVPANTTEFLSFDTGTQQPNILSSQTTDAMLTPDDVWNTGYTPPPPTIGVNSQLLTPTPTQALVMAGKGKQTNFFEIKLSVLFNWDDPSEKETAKLDWTTITIGGLTATYDNVLAYYDGKGTYGEVDITLRIQTVVDETAGLFDMPIKLESSVPFKYSIYQIKRTVVAS